VAAGPTEAEEKETPKLKNDDQLTTTEPFSSMFKAHQASL